MDRHELFLAVGILRQLVTQGGIVLQHTQRLLGFRLIDRNACRCVGIGIGIHEIGEIAAEARMIRTHRLTQLGLHTFRVYLIDRPADRTLLRGLIIATLSGLIITQEGGHVPVALRDLTLHHAGR